MAAAIGYTVAATAAPYLISGIGSWIGKTIQVKGPNAAYDSTISASAAVGQSYFGWPGALLGRAAGWIAAPFTATSPQVQGGVNWTSAAVQATAAVTGQVAAAYLTSKTNPAQPVQTPSIQDLQEALAAEIAKDKEQAAPAMNVKQIMELGARAQKLGLEVEPLLAKTGGNVQYLEGFLDAIEATRATTASAA
jgi:hypothetical protein